jgi:hypothetical protein
MGSYKRRNGMLAASSTHRWADVYHFAEVVGFDINDRRQGRLRTTTPDGMSLTQDPNQRGAHMQTGTEDEEKIAERHLRHPALLGRFFD